MCYTNALIYRCLQCCRRRGEVADKICSREVFCVGRSERPLPLRVETVNLPLRCPSCVNAPLEDLDVSGLMAHMESGNMERLIRNQGGADREVRWHHHTAAQEAQGIQYPHCDNPSQPLPAHEGQQQFIEDGGDREQEELLEDTLAAIVADEMQLAAEAARSETDPPAQPNGPPKDQSLFTTVPEEQAHSHTNRQNKDGDAHEEEEYIYITPRPHHFTAHAR